MARAKFSQRKCDSCGQWNQGNPKICEHCGKYVDLRMLENEKREEQELYEKAQKEYEISQKHPIIRFAYKIGRIAETVFIAVVTALASLIFWLGG